VHCVFLHTQTLEGMHYVGVVCFIRKRNAIRCAFLACVCVRAHTTLEVVRVSFMHRTLKDVHYIGCAFCMHTKNTMCALCNVCVFCTHKTQESVHVACTHKTL
jgi:hypothetical protein